MGEVNKLLQDHEFNKANKRLVEVIEKKDTDEAQEIHNVLESLIFAEQTVEEGDLDSAEVLLDDIAEAENDGNYKEISIMKRYATQEKKQIKEWKEEKISIANALEEATSYGESNEYDKGITLLTKFSEKPLTHPEKEALTEDIAEALKILNKDKKTYDEAQKAKAEKVAEEKRIAEEAQAKKEAEEKRLAEEAQAQKEAKEKKKAEQAAAKKEEESEEKSTQSNDEGRANDNVEITKEMGREYVIAYAQVPIENPNVFVEYDHDNENGDWVYRVYEVVIDVPETKEGHTATWNWYAVDPSTGYIYNNMATY